MSLIIQYNLSRNPKLCKTLCKFCHETCGGPGLLGVPFFVVGGADGIIGGAWSTGSGSGPLGYNSC